MTITFPILLIVEKNPIRFVSNTFVLLDTRLDAASSDICPAVPVSKKCYSYLLHSFRGSFKSRHGLNSLCPDVGILIR
jgi:hypothetical protein